MRTGIVTLGAGAALLAVLVGTWAATRGDALAGCRGGQVAGDLGGPFTLVNARGEEVTDAEVVTTPTILTFGYTFCPDVCPLDAARNAEAVRILEERGLAATPVWITFDPARDTPEVVGRFADNFHPRMVGLTGSQAQVDAAADAFRVYRQRGEGEDEFYLMDHSSLSYLLLPEVGFVDFVGHDALPEEVADRLQCFAEAA